MAAPGRLRLATTEDEAETTEEGFLQGEGGAIRPALLSPRGPGPGAVALEWVEPWGGCQLAQSCYAGVGGRRQGKGGKEALGGEGPLHSL